MLNPLEQFVCDVCGRVIESPSKGIIKWDNRAETPNGRLLDSNFKIIHKNVKGCVKSCDDREGCWLDMDRVLGPDGLVMLTSFLHVGPLIDADETSKSSIISMPNFVDLIRRLQIPHYEEARQFFNVAEVRDIFSDHSETSPYTEKHLKRIIEIGTEANAEV